MERDIKYLRQSLDGVMKSAETVVKAAEEDLMYL